MKTSKVNGKKVIHGLWARFFFSHGKPCTRRTKGKQLGRFLRWFQWGWQMDGVTFHSPPSLNNQRTWPLYLVSCHRESGVFFSRISSSLQGFLHWLLRKTKAQGKAGYQCHRHRRACWLLSNSLFSRWARRVWTGEEMNKLITVPKKLPFYLFLLSEFER